MQNFEIADFKQEIKITTNKDNIKPNFCGVCIAENTELFICSDCGQAVCEDHFNEDKNVCAFCDGYFTDFAIR